MASNIRHAETEQGRRESEHGDHESENEHRVQSGDEKPDEGFLTRATEEKTAGIPSILYLAGAVGSMAISAALQARDKKELSLFVGQWAPSFMLLGIYNKIVKVEGSD